ncbi:ABC transporter permease [Tenggerimyces flavus]|uniref:ABC transporter permease n=1 Tax=Tenggerimyces flavus TaxID=1708749 RepID=A0ABV7YI62_9ACTN|nr:ABC transporter permease [Tenggerimyces flavus]MBM7789898.1 ABC-2 type transport system permease protein [Tenggerimyces flavus]
MSATTAAYRAGWHRGLVEFRQSLTSPGDLFSTLFWPLLMVVVLIFVRDSEFGSSGLLLGTLFLPSVIGMNIAANGMLTTAGLLAIEREDGTLLRAKATPNGMQGYVVGKIVTVAGTTLIALLVVLIPGVFLVDGLAIGSVGAWVGLAGIVALGIVATLPIGLVIGSLFDNPRNAGLANLLMLGVIGISGIFYPLTALPTLVQWIAQVFPVYWLGLGARSVLLPDSAAAVELGSSWRTLETVGVLGIWAIAGLVLAPIVLRRMARRESGSALAKRREQMLQRTR